MLDVIAKLGIGGGVGFLLGLVAVWWIEPTTDEGTNLLIVIFIIVSMVVSGMVSRFLGRKKKTVANSSDSSN